MLVLGLALLLVAVVLVLAEAHLTTGGLIASVAIVALVAGVTLLLVGAGAAPLAVLLLAGGVLVVSVAGLLAVVHSLAPVRKLRPRSGPEGMLGHVGVVRVTDSSVQVFVEGGLWRARPSVLDEGSVFTTAIEWSSNKSTA